MKYVVGNPSVSLQADILLVLPRIMDGRKTTSEHGFCTSLVNSPFNSWQLCSEWARFRYDLNALFAKAFGDFSVNVQGLSRVCAIFSNAQGFLF